MGVLSDEKIEFRTLFGQLVRERRQAIKYSSDDLAKVCNIGRTQLVNIETKGSMPSMYVGMKLCAALNIDLKEDMGMRVGLRFANFSHY